MKITFEGQTIRAIFEDMERTLYDADYWKASTPAKPSVAAPKPQGLSPDIFTKPAAIPVSPAPQAEKPKRERTEKQKANDERLRERALAKKAAGLKVGDPMPERPMPPPPKTAEGMDPAEVVRLRQKTIEDLQSAYANGYQKEVFELLSRFGNGAKSFRELPPESFVPIREAIDNGALT